MSYNRTISKSQNFIVWAACIGLGALLIPSCYGLDKYWVDPSYTKCDNTQSICPKGQTCDVQLRKCVVPDAGSSKPDASTPLVQLNFSIHSSLLAQNELQINGQKCTVDQTCSVQVPAKGTITISGGSNQSLSVYNSYGEEKCQPYRSNNVCILTVGDKAEALRLMFINDTICETNWCPVMLNASLRGVWSADGQRVFVVGDKGLILASEDGGKSWVKRKSNTEETLNAISASLNGNGRTAVAVGNGVIVSSDNAGVAWGVERSISTSLFHGVWVRNNEAEKMVVGKGKEVLYFSKETNQWTSISVTSGSIDLYGIAADNDGSKIFAVGDNGAIYSFIPKNMSMEVTKLANSSTTNLRAVAVNANGSNVFAVGEQGQIGYFKNTAMPPDSGVNQWDWKVNSQTTQLLRSIAMSSNGQNMVAVGLGGIVTVSKDRGNLWTLNTPDASNYNNLLSVSMSTDGQKVFAVGEYGRLVSSSDGGSKWDVLWPGSSKSLVEVSFRNLSMSADGRTLVVVGDNGTIFSSKDAGSHWKTSASVTPTEMFTSVAISRNPNEIKMVAGTASGAVYLASDRDGVYWSKAKITNTNYIKDVAISADGQTLIAVGENGTVLLSTDGGSTWSSQNPIESSTIQGVAMSADGKVMVAISGKTILRSTDGRAWSNVTTVNRNLNGVAISADGKTGVAVGEGVILVSTDSGQNWHFYLSSIIEAQSLQRVAISSDGRKAIAVGDAGDGKSGFIVYSNDGGTTWISKEDGTPFQGIAMSADGQFACRVGNEVDSVFCQYRQYQ